MSAWLLWCWACQPGEPDRVPYLEALQADDPARCAAIGDPDLRSDCLAHTAAGQGAEEGAAVCAAIEVLAWRSECFFGLAEATGELSLCRQAGRFGAACADHLFEEAVISASLPVGVGEEAALREALAPWVARFYPESPPRYRQVRLERALAWAVEPRWREAPFAPERCGALEEEACLGVLLGHLHHVLVPGGDATGVCADGVVSVEESVSLGAFAWSAEGSELAGRAWGTVCGGRFRVGSTSVGRGR